jgi:hypothetical protein
VKRSIRHYRDKPSNNDVVLKAQQLRRARRRRVVSIKRVTFSILKDLFVEAAGHGDLPAQISVANHVSALSHFIEDLGFDWSAEVGELLRSRFKTLRDAHGQRLTDAGKARSYVKNRLSLLNKLQGFLQTLDYEGASITGDLNPLQQALLPLLNGYGKLTRMARLIGVSPRTLLGWSKDGRTPRVCHERNLKLLESSEGLLSGTLLELLPKGRRRDLPEKHTRIRSHYLIRLAKRCKTPYLLKAYNVPVDHRLRIEIPAFVRHKVEGQSSRNIRRGRGKILAGVLRSTGDKSWRTRPVWEKWMTEESMKKRWPEILDGLWVPSANRTWNALSAFLGWAMIAKTDGGGGLHLDQLTLGLLADQDLIFQYLDWYMENSGQAHGGHVYFLNTVLMLLHAKDGFLPKQAEIGAFLGHATDTWQLHCESTLDWIHKEMLPSVEEGYEVDGKSRKPFGPIQHILDLDRPLDAVSRAINRAELDRETSGGAHEIAWARNLALMAILMSNGLRLLNLINLTFLPDNSGQLRQTADGNWEIVIEKRRFKNLRGAAKEHDYQQAIDPALSSYVTRYIRTYRPLLVGTSFLLHRNFDERLAFWV